MACKWGGWGAEAETVEVSTAVVRASVATREREEARVDRMVMFSMTACGAMGWCFHSSVVNQEERVLDRRYHAGCVLVQSRAPRDQYDQPTFHFCLYNICSIDLSLGQIRQCSYTDGPTKST